jgi:hypothetical protein
MRRSERFALSTFALFILLPACITLNIRRPEFPPPSALPALSYSRIAVPFTVSGSDATAALENSVQTAFLIDEDVPAGCAHGHVNGALTRSPFVLGDNSTAVTINAMLSGKMTVGASSMFGGSFKTVNVNSPIHVIVTPTIDSNWIPNASLQINVEGQYFGRNAQDFADRLLPNSDAAINQLKLKVLNKEAAKLQSQWTMLFDPQELPRGEGDPAAWLMMNPRSLALGTLSSRASDQSIHWSMSLEAAPEVSIGDRPISGKVQGGPTGNFIGSNTVNFAALARLPYRTADSVLSALVGREYRHNWWEHETITDIRVLGGGDLLALAVKIDGFPVSGIIYFIGGANYDDLKKEMYIPCKSGCFNSDPIRGLDFTVDTKSLLTAGGNWLLHSKILADIQGQAHWGVRENLAAIDRELRLAFCKVTGGTATLGAGTVTPGSRVTTDDHEANLLVSYSASIVERSPTSCQ